MKIQWLEKVRKINAICISALLLSASYAHSLTLSPIPIGKELIYTCNEKTGKLKIRSWTNRDGLLWNAFDIRLGDTAEIFMLKQKRSQVYSSHFYMHKDIGSEDKENYKFSNNTFPEANAEFTAGTNYSATLVPVNKDAHKFLLVDTYNISVRTTVGPEEDFDSPTLGRKRVHTFSELINGPGKQTVNATYRYDPNSKLVIHIGWRRTNRLGLLPQKIDCHLEKI